MTMARRANIDEMVAGVRDNFDPEFFASFWLPLRAGDAADRKHDDLDRADVESSGYQRVSELVQQNRAEQRQNINRHAGARLLSADPDEQQEDQE